MDEPDENKIDDHNDDDHKGHDPNFLKSVGVL